VHSRLKHSHPSKSQVPRHSSNVGVEHIKIAENIAGLDVAARVRLRGVPLCVGLRSVGLGCVRRRGVRERGVRHIANVPAIAEIGSGIGQRVVAACAGAETPIALADLRTELAARADARRDATWHASLDIARLGVADAGGERQRDNRGKREDDSSIRHGSFQLVVVVDSI
jgi:hypothetical protein